MEILKNIKSLVLGALLTVAFQPAFAAQYAYESAKNIKSEKSLKEETQKEYQLLYFWATWCSDCREKLKSDLNSYESAKIEFKTMNVEKDLEKIKTFVGDHKVSYPVYYDQTKKLQKELGVFSVPTVVLVRKTGQDYQKISLVSGKSWSEIDQIIKDQNLK